MQVPLQSIWFAAQFVAQVPFEHTWPASHCLPALLPLQSAEAPQCERLDFGSVQAPPHTRRPAVHVTAHAPAEQTLPESHFTPAFPPEQSPAAPQCVGLVAGSTHVE